MMDDFAGLMPKDTPDYMGGAWLGCIAWAIGNPAIVAAFRAETGMNWTPGTTPLDRMIDEATGVDRKFITAFVEWVNVNIWGEFAADRSQEAGK